MSPTPLSLFLWLEANEWLLHELATLLTCEDAVCMALVAIEGEFSTLRRAFCDNASSLRPLSLRTLTQFAAGYGCWKAFERLRRERGSKSAPTRVEWPTGIADMNGLTRCQWILRHHPIKFTSEVMYLAAKRGDLSALIALHAYTHYNAETAIIWAGGAGHMNVVEWLLDHHQTAPKRRKQQEIQVQIHLRPDQSQFRALCWRHTTLYACGYTQGSYCFLVGTGFLPSRSVHTHEGLYPLVDWAVECDDIELFRRLQADPIGVRMCTTSALSHAVAHGRLEIVQWLLETLENQFDDNRAINVVLEEAAQQGKVEILDWLYTRFEVVRSLATMERIVDNARDVTIAQWISSHYREVTTPSTRAIAEVIMSGNLEMFLHITAAHGSSVLSPHVQYFAQAAAHSGHLEIVRWIAEAHPEGDLTPMIMLNAAIRGGHLAIVRWCIEELHAWDPFGLDHAMAQGRLDVLEFLHTTACQRATTKTVPVEEEIHFPRASSLLKGISRSKDGEVTARWVLQNIPETIEFHSMNNAAVFGWLSCLHKDNHISWSLTRAWLLRRPSFCRRVPKLPFWAVVKGTTSDLHLLEEIGHPELFSKKTLDCILQHSRDATTLMWFLHRHSSELDMRVVSWAARYGAVELLMLAKEKFFGSASSLDDQSPVVREFVSVIVWSAVRHDQVSVLAWVDCQGFPHRVLDGVWRSRVFFVVARTGKTRCLLWLLENSKLHGEQIHQLARVAIEHGQLQCLQAYCRAQQVKRTPESLLKAARRGYCDTVEYVIAQQPDILLQCEVGLVREVNCLRHTYRQLISPTAQVFSHDKAHCGE